MRSDSHATASPPCGDGSPTRSVTRRRLLAAVGVAGAALTLGCTYDGSWPALDSGNSGEPDQQPATAAAALTRAQPVSDKPAFSEVRLVEPWDGLRYLAGKHARYPGANLDSIIAFSAADILETADTDVMDSVQARYGERGVATLYRIIAEHILESLLDVYGGAPVVLALDAGHGGLRGVYFDPGSQGTEYLHARRVVDAIEELLAGPRYAAVTVRRVYNDDIGDDFFLPPPNDRKGAAALTMRAIRASMLAYEAAAWNAAHPEAQAAVHVLSVHFNGGSGGILVLHQGETVPDVYRDRSIAYAQTYIARTRPALIATGLLPYRLGLALGAGLSNDQLLYEPPNRPNTINPYTGVDRARLPRRYAMLQASLLERDYADGALRYHKLV